LNRLTAESGGISFRTGRKAFEELCVSLDIFLELGKRGSHSQKNDEEK
jgi:hypothetical protein